MTTNKMPSLIDLANAVNAVVTYEKISDRIGVVRSANLASQWRKVPGVGVTKQDERDAAGRIITRRNEWRIVALPQ